MATKPDLCKEAKWWIDRGYRVTPLTKDGTPVSDGWQHLDIDRRNLTTQFDQQKGIAVLLGDRSKDLVTVHPRGALAQQLVPQYLPQTDLVTAESGKSKWWFYRAPVPLGSATRSSDGKRIVTLSTTGSYLAVPPGLRQSKRRLLWVKRGTPSPVAAEVLERGIHWIAAAAALVNAWPKKKKRKAYARALADVLGAAGWSAEDVVTFIRPVLQAAEPTRWNARLTMMMARVKKCDVSGLRAGVATLKQRLGTKVAGQILSWLAIDQAASEDGAARVRATAVLELDQHRHVVRIEAAGRPEPRVILIPLSIAHDARKLSARLTDAVGHAMTPKSPEVRRIQQGIDGLPRIVGVTEVGWTPTRDAFVYGSEIIPVTAEAKNRYVFVPRGTSDAATVDTFTTRGSRSTQHQTFARRWTRSAEFRAALSLVCASPFLELIGAPIVMFHLVGRSELGKTALLKLALSAFVNPVSSQVGMDISKDSARYADSNLGLVKNFAVLMDETTKRTVAQIEDLIYHCGTGRTAGRQVASAAGFVGGPVHAYRVVCLLSGERPFKPAMAGGGGAARLLEWAVSTPVLPGDGRRWHELAEGHVGWLGRDVLKAVVEGYLQKANGMASLKQAFAECAERVAKWCKGTARERDAMAIAAFGAGLALTQLQGTLSAAKRTKKAQQVAKELFRHLTRLPTTEEVVREIRKIEQIQRWVRKRYIPGSDVRKSMGRLGVHGARKTLRMLRGLGLVEKTESRRIKTAPKRCYLLTKIGVTLLKKKKKKKMHSKK